MRRISSIAICFAATALTSAVLSSLVRAADAPPADTSKTQAPAAELKIIKPEDAKDYEGQQVTVEFTVVGGRELDSGLCFLNSSKDRDDPAGFTAFITKTGSAKFKENPATAKPADLFAKKTIRVTGKIETYQKKFEIKVDDPSQITIVEEKPAEEKPAEGDKKSG
jgi:DNA/RNA endonuclease YhcR with UshA esterase domain